MRDLPAPSDVRATIAAIARAWELTLTPVAVPAITPTTRLVVAGPSAIAAVIEVFAASRGLSWADQVSCVATPPGHRQLAANAAALLRSTKPTRFGPAKGDELVVVSDDADPQDRANLRSEN